MESYIKAKYLSSRLHYNENIQGRWRGYCGGVFLFAPYKSP